MTPKLNRNDCDSFYALMEAGEPQTVAQVAESQSFTSINLAAQSLRRLVIHGLAVKITPPIDLSLEYAVEFIADDELVEITPKSIRVRKRYLKEHDRKKASRPGQ